MQGNVVGNAGGTPNPYSVVQQPTDAVGNLRPTINKIKHLLSGIYQQFFVKPREAYKQWVFLNEWFLRMLKAEKHLSMKGKVDKVSAAMQAERTASSNTIKVMILGAVK